MTVRVRALGNGLCLRNKQWDKAYRFVKGDEGVLCWEKTDVFNWWTPFVVWDNDPVLEPRQILFTDVEVIGVGASHELSSVANV